jgi:hypothetical protein
MLSFAYAEWHMLHAKCHYAECRYADCRSAQHDILFVTLVLFPLPGANVIRLFKVIIN